MWIISGLALCLVATLLRAPPEALLASEYIGAAIALSPIAYTLVWLMSYKGRVPPPHWWQHATALILASWAYVLFRLGAAQSGSVYPLTAGESVVLAVIFPSALAVLAASALAVDQRKSQPNAEREPVPIRQYITSAILLLMLGNASIGPEWMRRTGAGAVQSSPANPFDQFDAQPSAPANGASSGLVNPWRRDQAPPSIPQVGHPWTLTLAEATDAQWAEALKRWTAMNSVFASDPTRAAAMSAALQEAADIDGPNVTLDRLFRAAEVLAFARTGWVRQQ